MSETVHHAAISDGHDTLRVAFRYGRDPVYDEVSYVPPDGLARAAKRLEAKDIGPTQAETRTIAEQIEAEPDIIECRDASKALCVAKKDNIILGCFGFNCDDKVAKAEQRLEQADERIRTGG